MTPQSPTGPSKPTVKTPTGPATFCRPLNLRQPGLEPQNPEGINSEASNYSSRVEKQARRFPLPDHRGVPLVQWIGSREFLSMVAGDDAGFRSSKVFAFQTFSVLGFMDFGVCFRAVG